jgi:hypothetical protein
MNNKAILTLNIGYDKIGRYSLPLMHRYAEKFGYDLINITEKDDEYKRHIFFNKFQINNYKDKYEFILYLDSDILINPNSPNIIEYIDTYI